VSTSASTVSSPWGPMIVIEWKNVPMVKTIVAALLTASCQEPGVDRAADLH
jgi:hypothetical protein